MEMRQDEMRFKFSTLSGEMEGNIKHLPYSVYRGCTLTMLVKQRVCLMNITPSECVLLCAFTSTISKKMILNIG
jgi:hypothetical protein